MGNLQKIRKMKNLSQGQLAIKSGVELRCIQAYEQRYRELNWASGETLSKLAKALDCSIADLLDDDACSRG